MDERRFKLAWEHFRFHAEQRTRMFHFFLITIGLLLNAFFLVRRDAPGETFGALALLMAGGVFSTLFFALDVRNTQLLEYSETLLRRIEESLYPPSEWHEEQDGGGAIRLGMLSREHWLKRHTKFSWWSKPAFRWIAFGNVKHKLSIRLIVGLSILLFWSASLTMVHGGALPGEGPPRGGDVSGEEAEGVPGDETPKPGEATAEEGDRQVPPWVVYLLCSWSVLWTVYAMARPGLDKKREKAAWNRFNPEPPAGAPGAEQSMKPGQGPMFIYVSGPYSPLEGASEERAAEAIDENVERASDVGEALAEKGHHPLIPHSMLRGWEDVRGFPRERALEICLQWVRRCDALFFLGSSTGAEQERKVAVEAGLPVYRNLEDVPDVTGREPASPPP